MSRNETGYQFTSFVLLNTGLSLSIVVHNSSSAVSEMWIRGVQKKVLPYSSVKNHEKIMVFQLYELRMKISKCISELIYSPSSTLNDAIRKPIFY